MIDNETVGTMYAVKWSLETRRRLEGVDLPTEGTLGYLVAFCSEHACEAELAHVDGDRWGIVAGVIRDDGTWEPSER